MENFGKIVATIRKEMGLSQDELANIIGTSGRVIGKYERSEIQPTINVATRIADALKVSLDHLAGRTDSYWIEPDMLEMVRAIEKLPKDVKEKLLFFIDMSIRDHERKDKGLEMER